MARKKRARRNKKLSSRTSNRNKISSSKNKISRLVRMLLLFVAFSLVSLVLYRFVSNSFLIIAGIFGFIAVGLFIALLVLWIMKIVRK